MKKVNRRYVNDIQTMNEQYLNQTVQPVMYVYEEIFKIYGVTTVEKYTSLVITHKTNDHVKIDTSITVKEIHVDDQFISKILIIITKPRVSVNNRYSSALRTPKRNGKTYDLSKWSVSELINTLTSSTLNNLYTALKIHKLLTSLNNHNDE